MRTASSNEKSYYDLSRCHTRSLVTFHHILSVQLFPNRKLLFGQLASFIYAHLLGGYTTWDKQNQGVFFFFDLYLHILAFQKVVFSSVPSVWYNTLSAIRFGIFVLELPQHINSVDCLLWHGKGKSRVKFYDNLA